MEKNGGRNEEKRRRGGGSKLNSTHTRLWIFGSLFKLKLSRKKVVVKMPFCCGAPLGRVFVMSSYVERNCFHNSKWSSNRCLCAV